MITISDLLSHLSWRQLHKHAHTHTHTHLDPCFISSHPLEHTASWSPYSPFSSTFFLRPPKRSAPEDRDKAGCSFHSGHSCHPLITMANQIVWQSAPIIKMTQINSLAMSQYIHSTYTDVTSARGRKLDVLICVCIVTCVIDSPTLLRCLKSANENHLSIITARFDIWGQETKRTRLFLSAFPSICPFPSQLHCKAS